jgi:hypothetical protein
MYWIPLLILPALSLVGIWDTNPSFALYSGNQIIASVVLLRTPRETKPRAQDSYWAFEICIAFADDWSMATMNVPSYPAERVLRKVAKSFALFTFKTRTFFSSWSNRHSGFIKGLAHDRNCRTALGRCNKWPPAKMRRRLRH